MSGKNRIILHVDMDHFFTAVEEKMDSSIKGKPVVVGADPKEGKGRGVVSTCNYEAREFGIHSGMPISRAWRLCPSAIYLPVNFPLYRKFSGEIMNVLRGVSGKFERWGLDEAFLDLTSKVESYPEAEVLANKIKKRILQEQGLTCSIGIGPNKLVAKMASDFKKPDGLTIIKTSEVEGFLSPLPVRKLLWIGKKTESKLNELGIKTIGDLAESEPVVLSERFGVAGRQMFQMAHGVDKSEVKESTEVKSISRERTFEIDTSNLEQILDTLDKISEMVHADLVRHNLYYKTITMKVRYENFETHTHSKTLPFMTDSLSDLKKTAKELADLNLKFSRKTRLIGVRVSNFVSRDKQKTLF